MSRASESWWINDRYRQMSSNLTTNEQDLFAARNHPLAPEMCPTCSYLPTTSEEYCSNQQRMYTQGNSGHTSTHLNNVPWLCEPTVISQKDFVITLHVYDYKQEELKVNYIDDFIIVEGKRGGRMNGVSLFSQQFTDRYKIPKDINKESIDCFLSSDGILSIVASKTLKERTVPIRALYTESRATSESTSGCEEANVYESSSYDSNEDSDSGGEGSASSPEFEEHDPEKRTNRIEKLTNFNL